MGTCQRRHAYHAFITEEHGASCGVTGSPFIDDCDDDQAGNLLARIYGPLDPPVDPPTGHLIEFDQREFLANPTDHGLGETGFVYVPVECADGATCRVHIAFHGCKQTTDMNNEFPLPLVKSGVVSSIEFELLDGVATILLDGHNNPGLRAEDRSFSFPTVSLSVAQINSVPLAPCLGIQATANRFLIRKAMELIISHKIVQAL